MAYRIKHKPTGLYFCPSRKIKDQNGKYVKSNLSKKGKIYHKYPSLSWCLGSIYTHVYDWDFVVTPVPVDVLAVSLIGDWKIEEVETPPPKEAPEEFKLDGAL